MNTNGYQSTTSVKSITFTLTLCLGIATVLFSTASSAAPTRREPLSGGIAV